jgi:DNA-binding NarL/FixJ family response regulator
VKILIVDDEQLDLFVSKKLLSLSYTTEGFNSLEETYAWAINNDFDIALIDYYLTATTLAPDVLVKLKELKGNTFRSFVLTNYVDDNQIKELLEAGFDGIIEKPLTMDAFEKSIQQIQ